MRRLNLISLLFFYAICLNGNQVFIAAQGTPVAISSADAETFINHANMVRQNLMPMPLNMPLLVWDTGLAATAQQRANTCKNNTQTAYEAINFRAFPDPLPAILNTWQTEVYDIFSDACMERLRTLCANIRSLRNDKSTKVGCATSQCVAQSGYMTVCQFNGAIPWPTGRPYSYGS